MCKRVMFCYFLVKIRIKKVVKLFCGFFEEVNELSKLEQGVCALPPFCDISSRKWQSSFSRASKEKENMEKTKKCFVLAQATSEHMTLVVVVPLLI